MKRTIKPYYKIISSPKQGVCEEKFHSYKGATDWLKNNVCSVHYDDHEFEIVKVYGVEIASTPMSLRYSQEELDEAAKYYDRMIEFVKRGKTISAGIIKYKLDRNVFYAALTELQRSELSHVSTVFKKTKMMRNGVSSVIRAAAAFEPNIALEEDDEDY